MKHIQFTLQFVILLVAIPLLVLMQFRHDYTDYGKQKTQTESVSVFTKKSLVTEDAFTSTDRLLKVKESHL